MKDPLLEVSNLTLDYRLGKRKMRALDRISFQLEKGEIMGVAGESGCGKSTLGLSIIKLLPKIAEILNATGIPAICSMLEPAPVFIVGFGCIFVAGLVKMLDEKLKKKSLRAE